MMMMMMMILVINDKFAQIKFKEYNVSTNK